MQATTTAYISDCTSPGSQAQIFSRFAGVMYLGFSAGPAFGAWLITHPVLARWTGGEGDRSVTSVFWVGIIFSGINFLFMLFVFPESLPAEKRMLAAEEESSTDNKPSAIHSLLSPLAVFLPVRVDIGSGRRKKDWSLTFLALALFGYMLSTVCLLFICAYTPQTHHPHSVKGLFQIKFLYATHMYGWGAEQLSYYISFIGVAMAVWLLVVLPCTSPEQVSYPGWH
jgi:MFS family permease